MIFEDPFSAMQAAVDIVGESPHPSNKVAATLFTRSWGVSRTNYWPAPILSAFGADRDIGSSSGTVHAETAVILAAGRATQGTAICITDPFCPNCAKNIAEAGIKKIYIDHKGFDKDFFKRRSGHFETMSMQICERAGISVFEMWRKDERLRPIYEAMPDKFVAEDSPAHVEPVGAASDAVFNDVLTDAFRRHDKRKFALAFMVDAQGARVAVTMRGHAVNGFTTEDPDDVEALLHREADKYSLFQEPVNRMLMYAARRGLVIDQDYFFSSQVPTSREQVNLVGAGIKRITVGDLRKARDPDALAAMRMLSGAGIIVYT